MQQAFCTHLPRVVGANHFLKVAGPIAVEEARGLPRPEQFLRCFVFGNCLLGLALRFLPNINNICDLKGKKRLLHRLTKKQV